MWNSTPSHITHHTHHRWCGPHAFNRAIAAALGYNVEWPTDGEEEGEEKKEEPEGGAGAAPAPAPGPGPTIRSGRDLLHALRKIVLSVSKSPPNKVRGESGCVHMWIR